MNRLKQIHGHTLRNGTDFSKYLIQELIRIPNISYARKVFDLIPYPDVFLYNKLIQAYSSGGRPHRHHCISLYIQMRRRRSFPNEFTFTFLFSACATMSSPVYAQLLHGQFVKSGFEFNIFALTAMIDMYAKLGLLALARQQFDAIRVRDAPMWNSLISGYARSGDMEGAQKLFDEMPDKNLVSWTSMISGYSQNGRYENALSMFLRMESEKNVMPNEVTIASVLPACANLGALEVGERIEGYARARGYFGNVFVCNALLDMYARCGKIDTAMQIFAEIGSRRDLCSWNIMIMGLAIHGIATEALDLFYQMQREGTRPDEVTFVGALLACTHGGLVNEGQKIFNSMKLNYKISPRLEHYTCMVDLKGRSGQLKEAYDLTKSMPLKPDSVIWGALLGACSFYNNVEFAEEAAEYLFRLEPSNPGNYVILSNIYARTGNWDGVAKLRKLMKGNSIVKKAGYSCIEEGGIVHKFIIEDKSHERFEELCIVLDDILAKIKSYGGMDDLDCVDEDLCLDGI